MSEQDQDQEFIEYVVKAIVDNPKDVKIERSIDEMGVLLKLTVNPADMGKIIGKDGNTAKSLRTLLRVLGAKNNARINLKIMEPEGGRGAPETKPLKSESREDEKDIQPIEEEKTTSIV